MTKTLFILYNADASILGKLNYSYRKLTAPKDCGPACAACDITHGGLHLDETGEWKEVKRQVSARSVGGGGVEVKQLHRDELGGEVSFFFSSDFAGVFFLVGNGKWEMGNGKWK